MFISCENKESDEASKKAATYALLKGRWNKISTEYKYYDYRTNNLIAHDTVAFVPGDYDEYTDTEYSEFLAEKKVYTTTYKFPDGKHINFEYNGPSETVKCEIKELTPNKLVFYREYIIQQPGSDQDGDKTTILYTCSR